MTSGFTERVRQELARDLSEHREERRAELAAMLLLSGSLHLGNGSAGGERFHLEIETRSGAVARAAFTLLQREFGVHPELRVVSAGGLRRAPSYVVVVVGGAGHAAEVAGLLDADGRLRRVPAVPHLGSPRRARGFARGALLVAGSVSDPERPAHLEVAAADRRVVEAVAAAFATVSGARPSVGPSGQGFRVVMKSGDAIGALLAGLGATRAFLEWDDRRLRRQLRGEANRAANADAANLQRAIAAAASQREAVERAVERVGWDALPAPLREVALARLADPSASLGEIGELCDPPVDRSTVYRRLRRLARMADEAAPG